MQTIVALFVITAFIVNGCSAPSTPAPPTKVSTAGLTDLASLIQSGTHILRLPAGDYRIGPQTLDLPPNFELIGAGTATTLHVAGGTKLALRLRSGSRLSNLRFDGHGVGSGGVNDAFISVPPDTASVTFDSVQVFDCPRAAIVTDHASDITIRDCRFERVALAVNILFSRNVRVLDNTVLDAKFHGLQFWGNWKWQQQAADNLLFSGNTVINGGNCCIWGSGARHVIMTGNFVDGAKDVGLDLEWCADSVISANVARHCRNAGISLFFACMNVAITGNSVANDAPISPEDAKADWWVRCGIWLTYPNRNSFPSDHGHENVAIVGNTIAAAPGERRAIWIGSESHNVTIANNAISGARVWSGGRDGEHPMHLTLQPNNLLIGPDSLPIQPTTQSAQAPRFD